VHFQDLIKQRPRDENLLSAVGAAVGDLEIWETNIRGWATGADYVREKHQAEGYEGAKHTVPMTTLSNICEQHVNGDIHFLKVDVEGFEGKVLKGMNFSRFRPWIVVVEATLPNSQVECFEDWEYLLTEKNYLHVYSDGLNRFYLANEHKDLEVHFRYPPNVFDDFVRSQQLASELRAQQAETSVVEAGAKARDAEAEARDAEAKTRDAEAKARDAEAKTRDAEAKASEAETRAIAESSYAQALMNSMSWKFTRPIRMLSRSVRRIRSITFHKNGTLLLRHASLFIGRRPKLKILVVKILNKLPRLKSRLIQLRHISVARFPGEPRFINESSVLSPHAQRIYRDLRANIERGQGGGL
jgi:FkbM family methyltransferase